jgi:restriction system protein
MAVPEFQSFMLPVLNLFSDNNIHTTSECMDVAINYFKLDDNDIKLTVPSGKQTLVANRVYWSLTYLKKSLLLNTVKRGEYKITSRGQALLKTKPKRIDKKLLSQYEEYRSFSNIDNDSNISINNNEKNDDNTPEEEIDKIYKKINEQLADDLLEIILEKDPYYFERLVMDVLTKMGYGDPNNNFNIVTKKSGDEGIDGIINQDKLGLDKIYVQAKRWNENVSRPELQKFVGALSAKKSNKGIFITTSDFTKEAKEYANNLSHTIILINGKDLTKLMIEYNVGVQINYSYDIKKIDNDYFEML